MTLSPTVKHWLTGLYGAAMMGSNASGTAISYDGLFGQGVDFSANWKRYVLMFILPAAGRMFGYLRRHPLPGVEITDEFRETKTLEITRPVTISPKENPDE